MHLEVIRMVISYAVGENGFKVLNLEYSPIKGPEGNIEYLLHLQKLSGRGAPEAGGPSRGSRGRGGSGPPQRTRGRGRYETLYIIANYDKEYVREAEMFIRSYLEGKARSARCSPAFPRTAPTGTPRAPWCRRRSSA